MKLINIFLLKHFLRILLLSIGAFIGIYLLIDFFEKISDFIDHKASLADYLTYLLNSIPIILAQIMPLAILMTVVLTLGSLGRTNEVTAMRACGISLWKIVQPFMALALLLSILLLLLNEFIVPLNAKALNQLLEVKLKGNLQVSLTRDEIWYRDNERIIKITLANPAQQTLEGVTIFNIDRNSRLRERLEIPSLSYDNERWQAQQLERRSFDPQTGDLLATVSETDASLDIGRTPQDFTLSEKSNNELNFQQLQRLVTRLELEGYDATRHRVDMHNRLAAPFTCLIMAFLGVPFALQRGRGSNIALGIGLSLAIGVVYFILQSTVTAFGYSAALPPTVAAWTSNIIFLMVGVWMLLSVKE
ncbi:MAG TPA: LPS export ABC transporter permease LptG [Malonomonas sp.]